MRWARPGCGWPGSGVRLASDEFAEVELGIADEGAVVDLEGPGPGAEADVGVGLP